jgi:hypothetical protein
MIFVCFIVPDPLVSSGLTVRIKQTKEKEERNMQDWDAGKQEERRFTNTEFDGNFHFEGVDHRGTDGPLICEAEGKHLWVVDDRRIFGNQKRMAEARGLGGTGLLLCLLSAP